MMIRPVDADKIQPRPANDVADGLAVNLHDAMNILFQPP